MSEVDTLVGVATGTPDGGVAIVRLSGPRAQAIASGLIDGPLPKPRELGLRALAGGEQGLVALMPGPRSFTGEDVVELQIHAGARNVEAVVEAALAAGAHAAGPGAFTRRAFDNHRLSLDQAEGIAALIGARTQAALEQARRLVAGDLGRAVDQLRAELERLRVEVEANLDFPEDVAAEDERRFARTAAALRERVEGWLAGFERGRRARSRARVVIAGPPNAGKSALFNALLGRRRALVSATAGTTRDYVEAELELCGRELSLVDTAGLRDSQDSIELAGVELGREQIAGADLLVWVESADQVATGSIEEAWLAGQPATSGASLGPEVGGASLGPEVGVASLARAHVLVENKRDLGARRGPAWIGVSAETGQGLDALREALAAGVALDGEQWIGLARHRDRAHEAAAALAEAETQLRDQIGLELVALSLAIAWRALGEITGRTDLGPVGESVLAAIFSSFCIGK